ncbi:MAG: adenylate/guanylate cyclase domain-containing protein [Actinomycetota bacterium]
MAEAPLQAGRDAIERHAWREAFDLLTEADKAERLTPDDLMGLGEAAWWLGQLDESIAAKERAYTGYSESGDRSKAAISALLIAQDYSAKLAPSIGAGWFNRAERLLENEPESPAHGFLAFMNSVGAEDAGDLDLALSHAERTLDIGTRYGDRDLQGYGLLLRGRILVLQGHVEEGLALLDEATVAAVNGEIGPLATGIIYCMAITTTAALADYTRASQWTEASKRWCERQSISGFPGVCRVHRAEIMRLRGSWAEAEREARRALTELEKFNLDYAAEGFYELGEVRLRIGDLPEAEDAFRQAHELGRPPYPGLPLLWLVQGKADIAASSIRRGLEDPHFDRLGRCRLLPAEVEIALAVKDVDRARAAVEELETTVNDFNSAPLRASALCARGALQLAEADTRAAVSTLRRGWRMWKEADLPYEAAQARMMLGAALRADGDEEAAVMEIRAARSAFERLGAIVDLRTATESLGEQAQNDLPKAPVPGVRVVKTFMFTDIVSSTNLVEAMGDEAWESLLGWHDQTLRKLFTNHCGEEVKQIGDGFFVAFDEATDAMECAVQIQHQLGQHRKQHGFAPQVRIGLHQAEATRKGQDYGGKGVHTAARIGALAQGGEILASTQVIENASRHRFPVSERRSVSLKGVSEPAEVVSVQL